MDEDGGTVEEAGGGVTGIASKQGRGEGGVSGSIGGRVGWGVGGGRGGESGGEAGVDEGGEHLLVAEIRTEVFVGSGARVAGTTDERQAV